MTIKTMDEQRKLNREVQGIAAALRAGDASLRAIAGSDCAYLTAAEWGSVATVESFADVDTPDDLRRFGLA